MECFQFGTGPAIRATERWTYEVCVASVATHVSIFQLPDVSLDMMNMPAILGFDVLGRWETVIVLRSAWKGMKIFDRPVEMRTAKTGHPFISLMEEPDEEPALPPIGLVPFGAASSSIAFFANASPHQQVASSTELPVVDSLFPSEEEPSEKPVVEGGRYVLLIHADVPQEEDAESEVYPVPTDAARSGASNDGGNSPRRLWPRCVR